MTILEKAIEYWQAGGILLIPIAVVCFGIWFYFLKARGEMKKTLRESEELEEELVDQLQDGDSKEVSQLFAERRGMFSRAFASALAGDGNPIVSYDSFMEDAMRFLRRDLVVLAGLTAAAPLLGLLGTVRGMIETFTGVAAAGDTADYVAAGISQALITTQVGLVVAIPGVFGIARLQRLLASIKTRFDSCRLHLSLGLNRCSGVSGAAVSRSAKSNL